MKTAMKQNELPSMPDRTPLGKACAEFVTIKDDIQTLSEELETKRREILVKLQDEGKTSVIYDGHYFEIFQADLKVKVSKV